MKFRITNEPQQVILDRGFAYAFNTIIADGIVWLHLCKTKPKKDFFDRWSTKDAIGYRSPMRQKIVGKKDEQFWVWTTGAKKETIVECYRLADNLQKKFVFVDE